MLLTKRLAELVELASVGLMIMNKCTERGA
jgi:hypothetical protein